jgi:hypothetical protein
MLCTLMSLTFPSVSRPCARISSLATSTKPILQMYWLMVAGGNVTRCRYCGRIISLTSPLPGTRKTRQDKKFCDDACRQRHHYHTRTKLKRQGKSR